MMDEDLCPGGIALAIIGNILAARIDELQRVLKQSSPEKGAGRRAHLATLRQQLHLVGRRKKDASNPALAELTPIPWETLGRLEALANGEQGQRRILRDLVTSGTALELLETLESR